MVLRNRYNGSNEFYISPQLPKRPAGSMMSQVATLTAIALTFLKDNTTVLRYTFPAEPIASSTFLA